MSDQTITKTVEIEPGMAGSILIPLRELPTGSLITITIRVGPEQPAAPGEAAPKRYMGGPRING